MSVRQDFQHIPLGGICFPCSLGVVPWGFCFPQCKTVGNSLLFAGSHLQTIRFSLAQEIRLEYVSIKDQDKEGATYPQGQYQRKPLGLIPWRRLEGGEERRFWLSTREVRQCNNITTSEYIKDDLVRDTVALPLSLIPSQKPYVLGTSVTALASY